MKAEREGGLGVVEDPPSGGLSEAQGWLASFARSHGRRLRVLHVGNIANNAYLNAKFLRQAGVECDVLCADYYHIMGCPEWEDVDFEGAPGSQNRPDWREVDLGDYRRPRWFVQGPMEVCMDYLEACHRGDAGDVQRRWLRLEALNGTGQPHTTTPLIAREVVRNEVLRVLRAASFPEKVVRRGRAVVYRRIDLDRVPSWFRICASRCGRTVAEVTSRCARFALKTLYASDAAEDGDPAQRAIARAMVAQFDRRFPDRRDRLTGDDVLPYARLRGRWQRVLDHYDVVQAYAVDPIYPLLAGTRPYVAFEHGTLRDFTLGDNPLHRLTALAYRESDHVFITNGDCLDYARRIGIERWSPMIHPVDLEQHERRDEQRIRDIRDRFGAELLLFCPLRHDWSTKGTDVHIRALPFIVRRCEGRVVLVLSAWGKEVAESRALARELGVDGNIAWTEPLSRPAMIRLTQACDVVLDQMTLPHFGATAPQSIAAGTPVVMSYHPASTEWIVGEQAPILAAFSPMEVAAAVGRARDRTWLADFRREGRRWIQRHHSPARLVADHIAVYRRLIERSGVVSRRTKESLEQGR